MAEPNSLIAHLIELRGRVLKAVVSVFVVFLCLVYFAQDLYHWLATPLLDTLPENAQMIATDVASPFFAPFKLTMVLSFFIAIPVVLYQIWGFVAPGLYKNEKRLVAPLLFSSTLLFYLGMAFAYYVVFPLAFSFFTSLELEGVVISTDISSYLNFVLKIFFAFGLAFEIPVAPKGAREHSQALCACQDVRDWSETAQGVSCDVLSVTRAVSASLEQSALSITDVANLLCVG